MSGFRSLFFFGIAFLASSRAEAPSFAERLVVAAMERTKLTVRYEPAYVRLDYPNGDVPADTGVCTDVVIRCYRALRFDLQKLVHEDMKRSFSAYLYFGISRESDCRRA